MNFTATARYRRISTRRVRLVADLVRGRNVLDALKILKGTPKAGAIVLSEVIESARVNAVEMDKQKNLRVNPDLFVVSELKIDGGPIIKRFRPMSMGRAGKIRRRTTHITAVLSDGQPKEKQRRRK